MSMHREDYIALVREYPVASAAIAAFVVGFVFGYLVGKF